MNFYTYDYYYCDRIVLLGKPRQIWNNDIYIKESGFKCVDWIHNSRAMACFREPDNGYLFSKNRLSYLTS